MPNDLIPNDPARFGLARFADLLPAREHIVGEDPGSFDGFHEAMMQALAPLTPYEGVIAENLIAIEWELIQHRRMRDAGLRAAIRDAVIKAVIATGRADHEALLDAHFDKHTEAGGTQDDWEEPFSFDTEAAKASGAELAAQAISKDPAELTAASKEIEAMGQNVVELMGGAYRTSGVQVRHHDQKGQELERRRREVKRDFDALQKARPVVAEAEVIEG
ncbi:hypothetical protein AB9F26_11435 [Falsihalocynthiibacter sp. BN13B15]|uniref:hypothetical protein n=1 Tax=Falsihalocynthiibacter sp. BN13B15 TaxID=3240871 RepID=UPI0035108E0D